MPTLAFASWQNPVLIDSGEASYYRPRIKARNDSVYVSYSNIIVRSLDRGLSWQDPHQFESFAWLDENSRFRGDTLTAFGARAQGNGVWLYFSTDFAYS